ncbi:unnamed protein product [Heterobilharzia americana]|nr:unnamed protein product [Heterobilharzia americana]
MGAILSRFTSRKDETNATTDSRPTGIRKRFSWRTSKKPGDVSNTTVNRSSTLPARTRLQTTEEVPENRRHGDIFDEEKTESNSVATKPLQTDNHSHQPTEQCDHLEAVRSNESAMHEMPETKDQKQVSGNLPKDSELKNKDSGKCPVLADEAEILIAHVLPKQENSDKIENIMETEIKNASTHVDTDIKLTTTLERDEQNKATDHATFDAAIKQQQELLKNNNELGDSAGNHFEDKTHSLQHEHSRLEAAEMIHEDTKVDVKIAEQCLTEVSRSKENVEFVDQTTEKYENIEELELSTDAIDREIESAMDAAISESIQHEEVVKSAIVECFAEPSIAYNPSSNERVIISAPDNLNENVSVTEAENELIDESSETVECKNNIPYMMVQNVLSEPLSDMGAHQNLPHDESLPRSEHIERHADNSVLDAGDNSDAVLLKHAGENVPQEVTQNQFLECVTDPGVTCDPLHSESPIISQSTETIREHHTTEAILPENDELMDAIHEEIMQNQLVECVADPSVTCDPLHSESPIISQSTETIREHHTTEAILPENDELMDAIHEEIMQNQLVECVADPGVTCDPIISKATGKIGGVYIEQTESTVPDTHPGNTPQQDMMPEELVQTEVLTEQTVEYTLPENEQHSGASEGKKDGIDMKLNNDDSITEKIHNDEGLNTEMTENLLQSSITYGESTEYLKSDINSVHTGNANHEIIENAEVNNESHANLLHNLESEELLPSGNHLVTSESILFNHDQTICSNLENTETVEDHEVEKEANSFVQSILKNAQEHILNENHFDNQLQSNSLVDENHISINNTFHSDDVHEDTIDVKKADFIQTEIPMEHDQTNLSEMDSHLSNNSDDVHVSQAEQACAFTN